MKTRIHLSIVILTLGIVLLPGTIWAYKGMPIERAQRGFQARYHALTGNYVEWPNCRCGDGKAPRMPKDGFYGDTLADPDFAASLVQDLASKFFGARLYILFVKGSIDGESVVTHYADEDMPTVTPVTRDNYAEGFSRLYNYIRLLRRLDVNASYAGTPQGRGDECPDVRGDSCEGAIEAMQDEWESQDWSGVSFAVSPTVAECMIANDETGGSAAFYAYRNKITADLRRYNGTALLYLQVGSFLNSTFGGYTGNNPPVSPDLLWHASIPATLGAVWVSDWFASPESPNFTLSCPNQGEYGYWWIDKQIVIVNPDFDTSPDGTVDCAGCGGNACSIGGFSAGVGSAEFKIGLGFGASGSSAGFLLIHEASPSMQLASVSNLQYLVSTAVQKVLSQGTLRQALAPQGLADIVVENSSRYRVHIYSRDNVGSFNGTIYPTNGSPFVTFTIENPNPTTNNTLRVTEARSAMSVVNNFVWSDASQQWELASGNALRCESLSKVWDAGHSNRTETLLIKSGDCQTTVYKEVKTYHLFPWAEELATNIVGSTGASLMTTWSYYDDVATNDVNYAHLKQITEPSGRWERYEYDSAGRPVKVVSQFLDSAVGSAESQNRVTTTMYTNTVPQETIIEKLEGQEVSRHYRVFYPGEIREIQCQTSGAAWNASDNLVTITTNYISGLFSGEVRRVTSPDGTMSIYESSSNSTTRTTIVYSGQPNGGGTAIVDGTKSSNVVNFAGQPLVSATYDIVSGLLLSQSTTTQTDSFGRATTIISLDGTNTYDYGCCNTDSSTDKEGITTDNAYDALRRLSTTARAGITSSNVYNAAGQVVATFRNGVRTSASGYDTAGRLTSSVDALMNATSFAETIDGSGHTVKTTTYTNGTTRVETYYKDGQLLSVTGTAVHGVRYEYGVDGDGQFTKEIKLNTNGTDSSEWTKTHTDFAGRTYKTVYADDSSSQSYYNNKGELTKQLDPDGVATLFSYNGKGELVVTVLDMDRDDAIGTSDRITSNVTDLVQNDLGIVRRTTAYVYSETGPVLSSISEIANNGLKTRTTTFGLTSSVTTVYDRSNARRTVTTTNPDSSYTISTYEDGRLMTEVRRDSGGVQVSAASYEYDNDGRMRTQTDARNGATTYSYNNGDQLVSVTTPVPATGQSAQMTQYDYDSMGRRKKMTLPDNGTVTYEYFDAGELKKTYGARTYPVEYTYDYAGRMKTLKTWRDYTGNTGTATTTWNYDAERGFLIEKVYDDSSSVTCSNSAAGRLVSRKWARGVTTSYTYNNAGEVSTIAYSDATPEVIFTRDRRGRVTGAQGISSGYNDAGQLTSESRLYGAQIRFTVTNAYDSVLRRAGNTLLFWGETLNTVGYGYDSASRLSSVSNGAHSATYVYLPNSSLVSNIVFATNGAAVMVTAKNYDNLNRLRSISHFGGGGGPSSLSDANRTYTYNNANQRTRVDLGDGSYWTYQYDSLGQVTSGKKYWPDNSEVAGQQFGYDFDDIGNRKTATVNSNAGTYTVNSLNQYTQRTVAGAIDVLGTATSNATVTVNNQATQRKGDYFYRELSVSNSVSAEYTNIWVVGVRKNAGTNQQDVVTQITGHEFAPKTPEIFGYDSDGNLTNDGRWAYSWDAENRVIQMQTLSNLPASVPQQKLAFNYDYQGRRIVKRVSNYMSGSWVLASELLFVYDGWNLVGEFDASHPQSPWRFYTWGLDLSGSEQGAGGIGGLLAINAGTNGTHFVAYDGNGDVVALVKADTGDVSAQYEYSPFGETLRATGSADSLNPFRFSTKYTDGETSLLYYGYRYYNASAGRWLSRDPIEEKGGENLCRFAANNPVTGIDWLGLVDCCACCVDYLDVIPHPPRSELVPSGWLTLSRYKFPFEIVIVRHYGKGPGDPKHCHLTWHENWLKGTSWTGSGDITDVGQPTFGSYLNGKPLQCGQSDQVWIPDAPGKSDISATTSFDMDLIITVSVSSGSSKACKYSKRWVSIHIKARMVNGKPDYSYEYSHVDKGSE